MHITHTIYKNNDPEKGKRGGGSEKLKFIKSLVEEISKGTEESFNKKIEEHFKTEEDKEDEETEGKGLKILPSDPNALIDRFDLLFTSQKAGHTGVRNEIVSILDELKRQGVINTNTYKKLNSIIKK